MFGKLAGRVARNMCNQRSKEHLEEHSSTDKLATWDQLGPVWELRGRDPYLGQREAMVLKRV